MAAIKAWMHTVSAFTGRVPNSFATATIGTATTNNAFMVFVPPVNMTVTQVAFYVVSTTGVLGTDLIKASIQSVAATSRGAFESGKPSGTIIGTSATVAANTMNSAAINQITGLSAPLTAGTPYALVIEPNATWSGTSNMVIRIAINETSTNTVYLINGWYAGTGANNPGTSGFPVLLFGTSTNWYGHPCPDSMPANQNITNPGAGSTYMQTAISFQLPSTITSCQVDRAVLQNLRFGWGSANVIYRIMDSTGTTSLQSTTATTDAFTHVTQSHGVLDVQFTGTKATLTGGSTYLFVVESMSGSVEQYTMDIDLTYVSALSNTFADLKDGAFIYRTGTSGLWTQVNTFKRMNPLSLQLSDIVTAGGSSGGLIVHPGMRGGING